MASSRKVLVTADNTGLWILTQSEEAARKASELMQRDLQDHHVFLNDLGFHDHMPHHILALYGTGASAEQMQTAYDLRDPLQRSVQPVHEVVVAELHSSWENCARYLGQEEYYPDFLQYFQREIDARGYEEVVNLYLFKGDERANDLLTRLHAGVVHPLIQLMYGLEWKQPAVVAEALAQTCVHGLEGLDQLLPVSEGAARQRRSASEMAPLLSLYESLRADKSFNNAVRIDDGADKIQGSILRRVKEPMLAHLQRVQVDAQELEEKTAEMLHTIILVASSAAVHPLHHVKFDFSLMHHVNSALLYPTINSQSWISQETKQRMLEWKIRMDLIQYVAQGSPPIQVERITSYVPKTPFDECAPVRDIGRRLIPFGDDGHGIKQARATAIGHEITQKYSDRPWVILKDEKSWQLAQHMVVDALEGPGVLYVRCAGLEEPWQDVPPQSAPRRNSLALRALQTGSGSSDEALEGYTK